MIKKFNLILFLLLFTNIVFGFQNETESESLKYLNLNIDESSNMNKVSYDIIYLQENNIIFNKFAVDIYYNGKFKDRCEKNLIYDNNVVSEKITCEVFKYGEGEYKFIASIYVNDEVFDSITNTKTIFNSNNIYKFENENATIEFIDLEDKTTVVIVINKEGENFKIFNSIPKSVILMLNEDNKNSLITTDFDYEIIESDPLIAWTVDKAPAKINYTINRKITSQEKKEFVIEVQNESVINKFKWVIYILILVIIGLTLKPAFKKD